MNYCPVYIFVTDRETDGQTESDAYEPTVHVACTGGLKINSVFIHPAP